MATPDTDRIADLEHKLDSMSGQLDAIAAELREQRLRRQQWDELREDLAPIAAEAMELASDELEAIQDFVQPEDMLRLLRRILRNTRNIEDGMARYESLMDFVDDVGPLTHEAFGKMMTSLESLEQRGYFDFVSGSLTVADRAVASFSKQDFETLSENIGPMLEIVKSLTQPEVVAFAQRLVEAAKRQAEVETATPTDPPGLFALAGQMRSPEIRRGLALALNTFKTASAPGTTRTGRAIESKTTTQSPEGGA